jgi:prohibitin 2
MFDLLAAVTILVLCYWLAGVSFVPGGLQGAVLKQGGAARPTGPLLAVRRPGFLPLGLGLAIFAFHAMHNMVVSVPAAHVGVLYDPLAGGVQRFELPEGLHFVAPWATVRMFRVQTQEYTMSGIHNEGAVMGDDSIHCQTNEGLGLNLDVTVMYHIDPKDAHEMWQRIGEDYERVLVRPYARNVIRMVVAKYSVIDVFSTKRATIEHEMADRMKAAFGEKGLVLESVLLRSVENANKEFAQAITDKQVAQQQINTEVQNLERARLEKQTHIAEARGEAEAIAQRAALLRANPEVVQYEMAQKIAPNVRSLYLPSTYLPLPAAAAKGR